MAKPSSDLARIEKLRAGLLQFLIVVVMCLLGGIIAIAFRDAIGTQIPGLAILALATCLYVLGRERYLKRAQQELVEGAMAVQARASALENITRRERSDKADLGVRLSELTALYRAISTVRAVMDHEQTFDTTLRSVLDLVEGDVGSVMLVDDQQQTLRIVAAHGLTNVPVGHTESLEQGVAGYVVRTEEPLLLQGDAKDDERFEVSHERSEALALSMCVPLALRGRVLGVLSIGLSVNNEKQHFSDDDLRFATLFAQHAAISVENASLLERQSIYEVQAI